ncbi:MAG TPA: 30S ribosomal protein S12 methylthiotransferase RimO [Terriglobia bacterium]|nr:30S ribosomal protein S12 methylthiotransferase RimO [Terriglobia bacterium]
MPKVGMVSLGCPKNLVDSEVMLGLLARQGYELTPHAEEADVLVVNTCSFIEPAKQESINTILDMAEHKKSGTAQKLVVAGCLVERYRKEILKQFPEVDFVIGTNELERVLEACQTDAAGRESQQAAEPYLYHEFTPRILSTPSYSAYIKIAEGCDHPCTFCVIPQMRGRFRSRRFESVVREAEQLAAQGVREITLVGQDTTSYGEDLGLRDGLPLLLRELGQIPELAWVRFLYCYPNRVTEALIEAVAETSKVAKYFDIPLQHSSRAVLKAMRRGSSGKHFLKMLGKIRSAIPDAALRTSLIVGFPGETEDDFQDLLSFVTEAEFDHLGVFLYSNEETCGAYSHPQQVPAALARRRRKKLMAAQRKISRRRMRESVGKVLPVLVEGTSEETEWLFRGRLETQAPGIDGQVYINDFAGPEPRAGQFRWATITQSGDYDLVARLEEAAFAGPEGAAAGTRQRRGLIQIKPPIERVSLRNHAVPHL